MQRTLIIILLVAAALCIRPVKARSASPVMPEATAAHFCQLLVTNGEGAVVPLSSYIRSTMAESMDDRTMAGDSVTIEQLFCQYVFDFGGWQSLRIFPQAIDGRVVWFAPADALPASVSAEHQKYMHDVFPRLTKEVQAGNWATVDAYIDRMLQYQSSFGSSTASTPGMMPVWIAGILFLLLLVVPFVISDGKKRARESYQ